MPRTTQFRSIRRLAVGAALVVLFPAAANAEAAPKKGPAPTLQIDQRTCKTGLTSAERYMSVTATAILRGTGDRVAMRFRVQQRSAPGKWSNVVTSDPATLGKWEQSTADGTALRVTKQLNNLWEDMRYRVVIQARGTDRKGKPVSQTSQRIVTCIQPQMTADVRIVKARKRVRDANTIVYLTLRNAGTVTAGRSQISVFAATASGDTAAGPGERDGKVASRKQTEEPEQPAPLLETTAGPLKSHATRTVKLDLGACTGRVRIVVEDRIGADGKPAGPGNETTVRCGSGKSAAKSSRR